MNGPAVPFGKGGDLFSLEFPSVRSGNEPTGIEGILVNAAVWAGFQGVFDKERQMVSVPDHKIMGFCVPSIKIRAALFSCAGSIQPRKFVTAHVAHP